jgi:hypothetical protein
MKDIDLNFTKDFIFQRSLIEVQRTCLNVSQIFLSLRGSDFLRALQNSRLRTS